MPSVGQKYKPTSIINTLPAHKRDSAPAQGGRRVPQAKSQEPQTKLNPAQSAQTLSGRGTGTGNGSARTASLLTAQAAAAASLHKDSVIITASDLAHIQSLHSPQKRADPSPALLQGAAPAQMSMSARGGTGTPIGGGRAAQGKGSAAPADGPASPGMTGSQSREAIASRARARKEYMAKLELERKKQNPDDDALIGVGTTYTGATQAPSTSSSHATHASVGGGGAAGADSIVNRVQDEEHDDVKNMNQMMLYAKCATIRDAQILEKKLMQSELEREEKRLDEQMELDRVRAIQAAEENERRREIERREGAKVVIYQIKQREEERLRAQEAREQEAQAMLNRMKQIVVAEEAERAQKLEAGRRLLTQVMEANNAQARSKLRKKQEELEEDARIADYVRKREEREAMQEAELARIAAEKEKEVARLRAAQERIIDRQSAIDELRAKRYQEAKDRKWRDEQLAAAQKKEAMRQEIASVREQQHMEKERRLAEQAAQEKAEYLAMINSTNGITDEEVWRIENNKKKRAEHRAALLAQMSAHDQKRHAERKKYLEEADVFARQFGAEKNRLDALKQQKLAQLEKAGVPPKYRAELAKKSILVAKIH